MKLSGSHPLPYPRPVVWRALMDPEVLSRTLPGCERLEATGDGAFAGSLSVAVGPVRGQFDGTLEMTERVEPESYHMRLAGQGSSGFLSGEGQVRLEEAEAGASTVVHYDLEALVGGRIAGVGPRLLACSARVIARLGLEGLEKQLAVRQAAGRGGDVGGGGGAGSAGGSAGVDGVAEADDVPGVVGSEGAGEAGTQRVTAHPAGVGAAPSQREFAGGFARGMWEELVPAAARPWVIVGVVMVVVAVAWLVVR
jgi:carbon monoxide dehydrogenase subunit G